MKKMAKSPSGDIAAKRQAEGAKHGGFKKQGEITKAAKAFK
jgi:hypothetical protein